MRNPHRPWVIERKINWGTIQKPIWKWVSLGVWWFKSDWKPEFPAEGLRIALFPTREKARRAIRDHGHDLAPFRVTQITIGKNK